MSVATQAPFPVSRGLAIALAAAGPVTVGGILAARAHDTSPMLAAPAIVFGVVAATGPALYIATAAAGNAPPLAAVIRAFGVALGAFGLALAGLLLPAAFLSLSSRALQRLIAHLARIRYRLLLVNALVAAVPLVGISFAEMHETQLLGALENDMIHQAELVRAIVATEPDRPLELRGDARRRGGRHADADPPARRAWRDLRGLASRRSSRGRRAPGPAAPARLRAAPHRRAPEAARSDEPARGPGRARRPLRRGDPAVGQAGSRLATRSTRRSR